MQARQECRPVGNAADSITTRNTDALAVAPSRQVHADCGVDSGAHYRLNRCHVVGHITPRDVPMRELCESVRLVSEVAQLVDFLECCDAKQRLR